jgi:alkaline phosphatase D
MAALDQETGRRDRHVHGVASGDPLRDRVVIWTRVTCESPEPVEAAWMVARDPQLRDVVASGRTVAELDADFSVHVDVENLEADHHAFYAFESLGDRTPTARTRTLPVDSEHFRFAMVSCAKFNAGFFNVYARIADRKDLNFLLHLGDYIYEASQTPPPCQTPGADIGRAFEPRHECVSLQDYRRRYAHYRGDADLQRLHRTHPFLATVDDHEFADGAWRDGATEHREERDGSWRDRRAAAFRAPREWMPYRLPDPSDPQRVFRTISLGKLADLCLIDTRRGEWWFVDTVRRRTDRETLAVAFEAVHGSPRLLRSS